MDLRVGVGVRVQGTDIPDTRYQKTKKKRRQTGPQMRMDLRWGITNVLPLV